MSEQFFAEDGCDAFLAQSGLLPETGIYVDAGCAHPWRYSQTAFLRNRGWSGLAIDGDPAYAPEWAGIVNAKFVNAVLSDKQWERFLVEPTNALVSRVHEEGNVINSYSLAEVMYRQKIADCDFLALDLEGMETAVLGSFLRHTGFQFPSIIVVEFNSCHKGRDVSVFNMMRETDYELKHLTDSNAIFVR